MNNKQTRNVYVDILKFIFSLMIVQVHSHGFLTEYGIYPFAGAYIVVEFYLIISGYYLTMKYMENSKLGGGYLAIVF